VAYTFASDLGKVCYSDNMNARLGLVVESVEDLIARLDAVANRLADLSCQSIRDGRGTYYWERPLGRSGGVAFLFPGEGSQYPGMLADLCPHFPEVRALFDTSDRLAIESGAVVGPSEALFGASDDPAIWEMGTAVNVLLSAQWAIYQLLLKLGLRPSVVLGHSSGEFLALAAAGSLRVDHGLESRFGDLGAVFERLDPQGKVAPARLLGAATSRDLAEAAIGELAGTVSVAVDNCPHQVVLAGPVEAVEAVASRLRAKGVMVEDLPMTRAYHTPAFAPMIGPLRDFFDAIELVAPTIPLYSCCSAGRVPDDPAEVRRLALAQWTRPVEFRRTVEALHADGLRVFIDVGARGNLAGFVEDTLRGKPAFAVAANLPRRPGLTQLNHLVASLFAQGVPLTPDIMFARRRPVLVDLDESPPRPAGMELKIGFPEMTLSARMIEKLRVGRKLQTPSSHDEATESSAFRRSDPRQESIPSPLWERVGLGVGTDALPLPITAPAFDSTAREPEDMAMLAHLATMDHFLQTQRTVMDGFLTSALVRCEPMSSEPLQLGPWAGEVIRLVEGREVEALITLEVAGDPVAEDHTFGGRRVSALNPEMKGLPVLPFTVMAEMLAQVAARLVPGATLVGLRDVRARRWVRYEETPITLAIVAVSDPERPGEIRASLFNRTRAAEGPEVEGTIVFAPARDEPPPSAPFAMRKPEPSRFTARSLYEEQWLFHGPTLQAVVEVGDVGVDGIEGTLRVLPRQGIYRDPTTPRPLTDPIVLDAFTHLLGCWGLDRLTEGDVIFPLRLGRLEVFGDDPAEGADCACRISIRSLERYRVNVDAEVVRPDGRVWMRLSDWDDWRFYWPSRYRDVFRAPDRVLIGEPIELPDVFDAAAVWLEPPGEMGRPVWRDVLEQIQLSPEERAGCLRPEGHDGRRTLRLWGRIAAKEAARRLWIAEGRPAVFPADLSIEPDPRGRPVLHSRLEPNRADMPAVSIAHTEGVAIAIASRDPRSRVGIDVERIVDRSESFEAIAFAPEERALIPRNDRDAWIARFWTAKEAAAKATGLALLAGPSSVRVVSIDGETLSLKLGPDLAAACPHLKGRTLQVRTARRGEHIWAYTMIDKEANDR
jgi:malonyl CoA-acyl carrier protein transacylase/phosphopantetheinyl transferase